MVMESAVKELHTIVFLIVRKIMQISYYFIHLNFSGQTMKKQPISQLLCVLLFVSASDESALDILEILFDICTFFEDDRYSSVC